MAPRILIIDPLTLLGREFLRCLEGAPELTGEVEYRHTAPDDEQQIAELGAEPALVPPLDGPEEIAGDGIVVVTSDTETERTSHLENLMIRHPETGVLDVGRLPRLCELTIPAIGAAATSDRSGHLRVAHPALVAASSVLSALEPLAPLRGSVAAVDPVSTFGREGLEILVHQAGRRMQGGDPDHTIGGHILAFNQISIDADTLTEEAAALLPDISLAVTRTLSGCFHGHLAHLCIELTDPVDLPEVHEVFDNEPGIVVGDAPMGLNLVPERDHILLAPPQLSPDRRLIALTAMVDGLRLGGALTAVEILRAMTAN
jgi:hypothetical protein